MDSVNKTLYIPLYGKAYVSRKGIIFQDKKAEEIWSTEGFSLKGKKLGLDDPRNFLFKEYLHIVEAVQPEVFVIENVKSLLSTAGGGFKDEILAYIERLGYNVSYGILNAK